MSPRHRVRLFSQCRRQVWRTTPGQESTSARRPSRGCWAARARATIAGSMVASLIPVILGTGLVILGVPSFYQLIVVGTILIAAVYVDQRRRERLSA